MSQSKLPPEVIDQACVWMARLWADDVTEADQQACAQWRQDNQQHERAWQMLHGAQSVFSAVPDRQAGGRVLQRKSLLSRRRFMSLCGLGITGVGVGALGLHEQNLLPLTQHDIATARGQLYRQRLIDGSELVVNTASRVDVTAAQKLINLAEGELYLSSVAGSVNQVINRDGSITPNHCRFAVRQFADKTTLSVFSGDLTLTSSGSNRSIAHLRAGQGCEYGRSGVQGYFSVRESEPGWLTLKLAVASMSLPVFLQELSRYRPGVIRSHETLAQFQVSGVFSLKDTDRVLKQLTEILPVTVSYLSPYWVSVSAV